MAMKVDREASGFTRRDASVGGRGLAPEFQDADWTVIREAVYEGRGGLIATDTNILSTPCRDFGRSSDLPARNPLQD